MQKIMFEHRRFGLEQAVIARIKEMTRRRVCFPKGINDIDVESALMGIDQKGRVYFTFSTVTESFDVYPRYQIGERVAVAQAYENADIEPYTVVAMIDEGQNMFTPVPAIESAGWKNKLFVRADFMPHVIEITDIKAERLQDISEDDCLSEGIFFYNQGIDYGFTFHGTRERYGSAKFAFAALIDALNDRGTWERNEWQFAYQFKLIK